MKSTPEEQKYSLASTLLSLGIALALITLLAGPLSLWNLSGISIWSSITKGLVLSSLLTVLALLLSRLGAVRPSLSVFGFALGMVVIFVSDWLCRGYNLLQGPSIRGEIILLSLISAFLIHRKKTDLIIWSLPIFALTLALTLFLESSGRLLFSDDNATFIYRFTLLKEFFPHIPFYGPLWNGGLDVRDFFATGALNVFLLFYPLFKLFPVEQVYNLVVCLILFVLTPAAVFISARLEKLPNLASAIAVLLAIGGSLLWYRWALKYGTLGFVLTSALIPLNLSLAVRIIARDVVITSWQAIFFVFSFSLMLLWSPSGLVFIPIAILALARLWGILKKRFAAPILIAILALNIPWIIVLWEVSKVSSFVSAQSVNPSQNAAGSSQPQADLSTQRSHPAGFKSSTKPFSFIRLQEQLHDFAVSTNPLLLLLLIPGIALLPKRSRLPLGLSYGWLVVLGTLVPSFKPQMEFDRMLVVLGLCASVPSAASIYSLLAARSSSSMAAAAQFAVAALCLGFVLAAPLSVVSLLRNRTVMQYSFANQEVQEIAHVISAQQDQGRILFSGFVLHELSEGHLAPLTYLTGKALMASSHVHNLWNYRQIVPAEFMARGDTGIEEYLDLYNVAAVFAHEKYWRDYFAARPEKYELVWKGAHFRLFKRLNFKSSYFLEGQGELLEQKTNRLSVKLNSDAAVLKFNYLPFLRASECELSEKKVSASVSFIALAHCPINKVISIDSVPVVERLARSWSVK